MMKTIKEKYVLKTFPFTKDIAGIDRFQDLLMISHIDATNPRSYPEGLLETEIMNENTFFMILVWNGYAEIKLDYTNYKITSDELTFIVPNHLFEISEMSHDFKAQLLQVDKQFMEEVVQEKKGFYNYIFLKRNPVIHLEQAAIEILIKGLQLLQDKIRLRTHLFQKEVISNATAGLLLELLNILVKENNDLVHPVLSRKEEIVDEFLKLLSQYSKERHPLSFYADKLFITPQYLSAILKEQTGKTGSKWLNEALIMEAKKLIKLPHSTIQAVAYTLNFSDQSTFGKFFKKSIGISPLVYRRM